MSASPIRRLGPFVQDIVYGASDGIVTTFGIVAGSVGAGLSTGIIVILGVGNLLGDGFSMAAGAFTSLRSARATNARHEDHHTPLAHACMTFAAFVFFGSIPLLPYIAGVSTGSFTVAVCSTGAALALVGITRSMISHERLLRGIAETLIIGTLSTSIAYAVGVLLKNVIAI